MTEITARLTQSHKGTKEDEDKLVSCPINNVAFVAIKMGRRSGSCPHALT
jgi:hypothetical protein